MAEQRQVFGRTGRPTAVVGAASAGALTPREVLLILRRHIFLIVFFTILGVAFGGAGWWVLQKYRPRYTATTFIEVLPPVEKDPEQFTTPQADRNARYGHRLFLASLLEHQTMFSELVSRAAIQDTQWFKSFGDVRAISLEKAVEDLRDSFSVTPLKDGDFIVVSMTCADAKESALILNEMVEMFISLRGSETRKDVAAKLQQRQEALVQAQRDLNYAEESLQQVRDQFGIMDLEERHFRHVIDERLNALEYEENGLRLTVGQIRGSIETYKRQAAGTIEDQVQVEYLIQNDPIMVTLDQQRLAQETQLAGLLTRLGENHKAVRQMYELINETKQKWQARRSEIAEITRQANLANAEDSLVILNQRLEELNALLSETSAKKRDLDNARVQYTRRLANRDESRMAVDRIKEQVEKLRIQHDDPETPKVQSVGPAPVPLRMSSPKLIFYVPGGTMLGLMLGVGLAFLIELLNDLVRTPRDVVKYLHIPLLGVIPDTSEDRLARGVEPFHVVRKAPYSIVSESYRRLRANLKLSEAGSSAKVLLVSSALPGDGKTSVSVNLAMTCVAEDKKVLLIDAHLRRPGLDRVFPKIAGQGEEGDESGAGLSSLLQGKCGSGAIVRSSGIEGFDIIHTGPMASDPAELLGGLRMVEFIGQQRDNYDYVIIDGPPTLLVSDSKMLARGADGTILVFNAGATRRGTAQRAVRELKEININVLGCVLFAVRAMKGGYFKEQYKVFRRYQKLQLAHSV